MVLLIFVFMSITPIKGVPRLILFILSLCFSFPHSWLLVINFSASSFSFIMNTSSNSKNALLSNPNPNSDEGSPVPVLDSPPINGSTLNDPPHPQSFPKAVILDLCLRCRRTF